MLRILKKITGIMIVLILIVLSKPLNIYAQENQAIQSQDSSWKLDFTGWWYRHANGSYTSNGWEFINGKWYYFNNMGYMTTGWQYINGGWYHMNNDGAMDSNQWIGNYYVGSSGLMATNQWIGNYYVGSDGCWKVDHWVNDFTGWWYQHADGSYTRNGWEMINGGWYYFDNSGYMATGWRYINGNWYHLNENGLMDADRWIGNYHVNNDGVWDYTASNDNQASSENNVQTVYWSGNGQRYHNNPDCKGLSHRKTSLNSGTVAEAVARGLTPCGICYR